MKTRIFLLVIIALVYSFACNRAGVFLVKKDEPVHADAIVILMGSISDRILQAVDLYQSGAADQLFIVEGKNDGYRELKARGADMISGSKQVRNAAVALGIPSENITVLAGEAQSTKEEAMTIRQYLISRPEIDTLILVSSSPHLRRASMVFKTVFKKSRTPVCIICCPNSYTKFDAKNWWRSKDGIEDVLVEYLKIANYILFDKSE